MRKQESRDKAKIRGMGCWTGSRQELDAVIYMIDAVSHSDVQELVTRKGTAPRSP